MYKDIWDVTFEGLPASIKAPPDIIMSDNDGNAVVAADGTHQYVANPSVTLWDTYNDSLRKWNTRAKVAKARIQDMCVPAIAETIHLCNTGREAWFSLQQRYKSVGWSMRYSLIQEMQSTTLDSCDGSVETYTGKFLSLSNRLTEMQDPLPEWLVASWLIGNLSDRFDNCVHTLLVMNQPPSIGAILDALNEEDRLQKTRGLKPNASMATHTKTQAKIKKSRSKAKKTSFSPCPHYERTNHSEDHCWIKYPEVKKAKDEKDRKAATERKKVAAASAGASESDSDPAFTGMIHDNNFLIEEFSSASLPSKTTLSQFPMRRHSLPDNHMAYYRGDSHNNPDRSDLPLGNVCHDNLGPRACMATLCALDSIDYEISLSTSFTSPAAFVTYSTGRSWLDWIIDSGCSHHMHPEQRDFSEYVAKNESITLADGSELQAKGRGQIMLQMILSTGKMHSFLLAEVIHVPSLTCGLVSTNQLTRKGFVVTHSNNDCLVLLDGRLAATAVKHRGQYHLNITRPTAMLVTALAARSTPFNDEALELWHRRTGHFSMAGVKQLATMSSGMKLTKRAPQSHICESCVKGKQTRKPSRTLQLTTHYKLEEIHCDVGFSEPTALGGETCYALMTDGHTGLKWVYPTKSKGNMPKIIEDFITFVENQSSQRVLRWRSDEGGEFKNDKVKAIFEKRGIKWEPAVPYAPDQNGTSEVANKVMGKVRAVLHDGGLPRFLWAEILMAVVYLYNRSPIRRLRVQNITPFEAWTGKVPDISHLRILGCIAWHHVPKEIRNKSSTSKLEDRSTRCQLVGYEGSNQYRLWDQRARKIIRSRDVIFDEAAMRKVPSKDHGFFHDDAYEHNDEDDSEPDTFQSSIPRHVSTDMASLPYQQHAHVENVADDPMDETDDITIANRDQVLLLEDAPHDIDQSLTTLDYSMTSERPSRMRKKSQKLLENEAINLEMTSVDRESTEAVPMVRAAQVETASSGTSDSFIKSDNTMTSEALYCSYASVHTGSEHDFDPLYDFATLPWNMAVALNADLVAGASELVQTAEPQTYGAARASPLGREWEASMDRELHSHEKMKTWTVVPRSSVPKNFPIIKGRWVYKIKRGLRNEILKYKSRWVAKGFEQQLGINFEETFASVVKPMSYKAMFAIAAKYDLDIIQLDIMTAFLNAFLKDRIYMELPDGMDQNGDMVALLNRALYGLKQSPREWYLTLKEWLETRGFCHIESDHSVFINSTTHLVVCVYVDDLLIFGPRNSKDIDTLKSELNQRFEMTDLGPVHQFLGMRVERNRVKKTITISQGAYINKVLDRFGMSDCKPVSTPMVSGTQLHKEEILKASPKNLALYQSMVGSLMYAMVETRPDIAYSVSVLSRYASNPTETHIAAAKRVLRYLKKAPELGITYGSTGHDGLVGYTDASWGNDEETRRSTGAYLFTLFGGAISWSSKRQSTVALSSCEAEYIAQTHASKEAI